MTPPKLDCLSNTTENRSSNTYAFLTSGSLALCDATVPNHEPLGPLRYQSTRRVVPSNVPPG